MKKYLFLLGMVSLALVFISLSENNSSEKQSLENTLNDGGTTEMFSLDKFYLPSDTDTSNNPMALAIFAWQEMIALNWKSTYNGQANAERDVPDSTWNYGDPAIYTGILGDSAVIWETYAHRSELRPATSSNFDVITIPELAGAPNYHFGELTPNGNEVITVKNLSQFHNINCLDEDNEIGSCLLFHDVDNEENPHDASSLNDQVLYQAKINKTGFDYRRKFFNSQSLIVNATNNVTNAKSKAYPNLASCDSDNLTTDPSKPIICFPCAGKTYKKVETTGQPSQGIIEIKTAWRRKGKADNPKEFFTRNAIYFTKDGDDNVTASTEDFVLIGMHINRKTENHPTFVIATWEHESVQKPRKGENYKYVSLPGGDGDYDELYTILDAKPERNSKDSMSVYDHVTDMVHSLISAKNPTHYLNHYRLVGVQGSVNKGYPDDKEDASFFLSNTVIESNKALRNFYGSFGSPQMGKGPNNDFHNLVNKWHKPVVAGGCKGCHGVAQKGGSDMSFIMDTGHPQGPDGYNLSVATLEEELFMAPIAEGNTLFLSSNNMSSSHISPTGIYGEFDNYVAAYPMKGGRTANNAYPYLSAASYSDYQKVYDLKTDSDGYPRTNLKILTFDTATNIITLGYIKEGVKKNTIPIGLDKGKRLMVGSSSAAEFKVIKSLNGTIQLTYMGNTVGFVNDKGGKLTDVLGVTNSQSISGAPYFQVYGYHLPPMKMN